MFVKIDFFFNRLISLVRIQLYFCVVFSSLFIVTSVMYFYPMNSDFLSLWLEFSKRTPKTHTFVPQEQGRLTESATGLIVCVFQACGGNGEGALSARKRKKARFAGEREVDLGAAALTSHITLLRFTLTRAGCETMIWWGLPARNQHLLKFSLTENRFCRRIQLSLSRELSTHLHKRTE